MAVGFGLWLRWSGLGFKSLWFDEGYTAWVASLPPGRIVGVIRADTAPPLYYLLLRAWVALAGHSEGALRAPSAACATAALGVTSAVVVRLFRDPWARAAGVSLTACSFMQVAYAHEGRFYAAVGLVGVVNFYLAVRACGADRPAVGWLAASAVGWAAGLWLNNISAIYLACLAVAWLTLPGRRPIAGRVRDVAVVAGVAAMAFAPWVPAVLAQRRAMAANYWSHPPGWVDLPTMLRVVGGTINAGGGAVAVAAGLAAAGSAVAGRRWRVAVSLALFGVLPVVVTFAYSRGSTSIFMDRAFIISTLVVPLLAVIPLEATAGRSGDRRLVAMALIAALLAESAVAAVADRYRTPDHDEDWRAACRYAAALPGGRRLTVFNANEGELLYDYYARGSDYAPVPPQTGTPGDYFDVDPPRTLRRVTADADVDPLRAAVAQQPFDAVVLVAAHGAYADPAGRTLAVLRRRMRLADERAFDNVTVYRFVPAAETGTTTPVD